MSMNRAVSGRAGFLPDRRMTMSPDEEDGHSCPSLTRTAGASPLVSRVHQWRRSIVVHSINHRRAACATARRTQRLRERPEPSGRLSAIVLLIGFILTALTVSVAHAQDAETGPQHSEPLLPERQSFVPIADLDVVLSEDREGVLLDGPEFLRLYAKARKNRQDQPRTPASVIISDAEYSARIAGDHLLLNAKVRIRQFVDGWQQLKLPFGQLSVEKATVDGEPARIGRIDVPEPVPQRDRQQAEQQQANQQPNQQAAPQPNQQAMQQTGWQRKQQSNSRVIAPGTGLVLLLNRKGTATLELELSTRLHASGNDRSAAFQLIPVPSVTLNVRVPAGRHLSVSSQSFDRPAPIDEPAVYSVPIGGSSNIRLLFHDELGEQSSDSLVFASTGYGLNVAPGEVTWQAKTSLQVFGTTFDRIVCTIPSRLEITSVNSNGLESWELADNPDTDDSTLVTLNYRQPFDGRRDIVFRGVMGTSTGKAWAVPSLTISNVTSHVGRVTLQHPAGVRVRLIESEGVRAVAAGSQTFDVWREDFHLAFETRTRERDLHATVTSLLDLAPSGVTFSAVTQVQTHFAPLFELNFRVPAEWRIELIEVNGESRPWQISSREAGWNTTSVRLDEPLPAGEELTFRFLSRRQVDDWPVEDQPVDFALPSVRIPEASLVEGTFVIRAGDDLEVKTSDIFKLDPAPSPRILSADERPSAPDQASAGASSGKRTSAGNQSSGSNQFSPGNRSTQQTPNANRSAAHGRERLRFFFQQPDYEGFLTVSRKPSRVSARSLTFTRLDREVLHSHIETTLDISGGGLRTLNVGLSETAGEDLRFRLHSDRARIVEQLPGDVSDGIRNWTLKLDQRVTGELTLLVDVATPRDDDERHDDDSETHAVHVLTVPAAERMNGFVAVEGAPDQQLQVTTQSSAGVPLETVDPIDVPDPVAYRPEHRIVAAYRYYMPGYTVQLSETRFDRVAVPTAVCYSTRLQSVIGRTGELQHRAEFQFVAVGAQSLRVRLPASSDDVRQRTELWSTLIDGKPIEVRSTDGAYIVPIPTSDEPAKRHTLVLFYRTFRRPLTSSGTLEQLPPVVSVIHAEGARQPLEILEQSWKVHYPDGTVLTSSDGEFTPQRTLDSVSLLTRLRQQFTKIDRRSLMRNGLIAGVLLVVVGAVALILRRVGVGIVGCVGATIALIVLLAGLTTFVMNTRRPAFRIASEGSVQSSAGSESASAGESAAAAADVSEPRSAPRGAFEGGTAPKDATNMMQRTRERQAQPKSGAAAQRRLVEKRDRSEDLDFTPSDEVAAMAGVPGEDKPAGAPPEDQPAQQPRAEKPEVAMAQNAQPAAPGFEEEPAGAERDVVREVAPRAARGRKMSGLLSLSMQLEIPQDSRSAEFHYQGTRTAAEGVGLRVDWQDRAAGQIGRLFLTVAVSLLLWLMIGVSARSRAILAVLGITVPLALVSVAPAWLHVVLDGVFLGTAIAVVLWGLRAACRCCCSNGLRCSLTGRSGSRAAATSAVLLAGLLAGTAEVQAAEEQASNSASETALSGPASQPADPESVIVPFDPDSPAGPLGAERVLLTREQFLNLWNLANPDERVESPAPRKGLISGAFYRCELKQSGETEATVRVEATLIVHNFRDHQITLPVPLGAVALRRATLDGQPASLRSDASGSGRQSGDESGHHFEVVIEDKGRHTLNLTFDVPAEVNGPAGQFSLPVRPVPAGRVVFELPAQGLDIRVNGSSSAWRLAPTDDAPGDASRDERDGEDSSGDEESADEASAGAPPGDGASGNEASGDEAPADEESANEESANEESVDEASSGEASSGDESAIEIPIDGEQPLNVSWRPPQQQGMVTSIVQVDTSTAVIVNDVGISEALRLAINVPQGSVSDLSFDLPNELLLRGISGPHLAGWELADEDGQRRLRVFFNPAITDRTRLDLNLYVDQEVKGDQTAVQLPVPKPREVTRNTGRVTILATENFRVRSGQVSGLSQVDVSPPPALPHVETTAETTARLGWRYSSQPFSLQFLITRRQPQSTATIQHAVHVSRRKIHIASRMRATLKGAPRPSLTFQLPERMVLLTVDGTSMDDWYVSEADGANPRSLTIEFEQPLVGDVEVVLTTRIVKFPNDLIVEVVPPFPLEISNRQAFAGVWFDDAYSAAATDVFGWQQTNPAGVPSELRQRRSEPLPFAFESSDSEPGVIGFEVTRAAAQLRADAAVMISVADTFLDYSLALQWRITDAAVDQLTFTTPEWLEDQLQFNGPSIRKVTSESEGDSIRWTIHLQQSVKGRYFALATATLPPAENQVETPAVQFLQPEFDEFGDTVGFSPVELQRLYLLLVNHSSVQLIGRHETGIEPVPAAEIPIRIDQSVLDQAAEVLRIRDIETLPSWTVRRLEQTSGAAASVNVADLTIVLAPDGTWRGQAVYTVRNRRRQFLPVELPEGADLLSLFVRDEPSRPVVTELDGRQVHLVPLPRASKADLSFQVKLVCSGRFDERLPRGFTVRRSDLDLPAPRVVTQTENAEFGIPVARTLWHVYLPESVDASILENPDRTNVSLSGDVAEQKAYLKAQLQDLQEMLTIVSSPEYTLKSKKIASQNLKQLNEAVQSYTSQSRLSFEGAETDGLKEQVAQVQQQVEKNRGQIDAYAQAAPGEEQSATVDVNGNRIVDERSQVTFNNQSILLSNSANLPGSGSGGRPSPAKQADDQPVQPSQPKADARQAQVPGLPQLATGEQFGFELKLKESEQLARRPQDRKQSPRKPGVRFLPEPQRSRRPRKEKEAGKQAASESRQFRRQQSLSNLDRLNSFVDEKSGRQSQRDASKDDVSGRAGKTRAGGSAFFDSAQAKTQRPGAPGKAPSQSRRSGSLRAGDRRDARPQRTLALAAQADGQEATGRDGTGPRLGAPSDWTHVGGLSLPVDIPVTEQSMTFSKVSGQPKLALRIRSRELFDTAIGFVWTLIWLGIGVVLIIAFSRVSRAGELWKPAACILFAAGLACFLAMPGIASAIGFVAFVVGLIGLAHQFVRSAA